MFEKELYEGIPDLLESLKKSSKKLYIATSKPHIYANMILDYFQLSHYFENILGDEVNELHHDKAQYIKEIIENNPNSSLDQFVMIGDRMHDIVAARKNNIDSIGVTFGFGDISELKAYGATFIVKSVKELKDFLLSQHI